jgi:hypothetical protein
MEMGTGASPCVASESNLTTPCYRSADGNVNAVQVGIE